MAQPLPQRSPQFLQHRYLELHRRFTAAAAAAVYSTMAPPAPTLPREVRPTAAAALIAAAKAAVTPQGISISGVPGLSLEDKILLARILGHVSVVRMAALLALFFFILCRRSVVILLRPGHFPSPPRRTICWNPACSVCAACLLFMQEIRGSFDEDGQLSPSSKAYCKL
jgi:hypothetical protein